MFFGEAYNKVPGLIGAGKESWWVSVHLVLEPGGGAVFCLPAQSGPELIWKNNTSFIQAFPLGAGFF